VAELQRDGQDHDDGGQERKLVGGAPELGGARPFAGGDLAPRAGQEAMPRDQEGDAGERPKTAKFWRATNELPFLAAIAMILAVTLEFKFH